jgi:hypothetical protein
MLLQRHQSLGIRMLETFPRIVPDPFHDSSDQAVDLLRPFQSSHLKALILRDLEGSGREAKGAEALEQHLHQQLIQSGWKPDNAAAIVLEPELESWMRFGSAHMGRVLAERARKNRDRCGLWTDELHTICGKHGGMSADGKPLRPKEVFHDLLKVYGIPPSNAVLGKLAEKESLQGCLVPSFNRFRLLMQQWFPND